jgi:hypothetical protein
MRFLAGYYYLFEFHVSIKNTMEPISGFVDPVEHSFTH